MESLVPIIYSTDIEGTIHFYTEKLGFQLVSKRKDLQWAKMQRNKVEIMISIPNAHLPFTHPVFTGSFYIYVNDVEKYWTALEEQVEIAYPLESFEYGMKEFAIYDNNGYMLQFGEELEE